MVRCPMIPMHMEILPSTISAGVYDTWLVHAIIVAYSQKRICGRSVHVDVLKRRRHLWSVPVSNRNCLEIFGSYFTHYSNSSRSRGITTQHRDLTGYLLHALHAYPL